MGWTFTKMAKYHVLINCCFAITYKNKSSNLIRSIITCFLFLRNCYCSQYRSFNYFNTIDNTMHITGKQQNYIKLNYNCVGSELLVWNVICLIFC